MKLDSLQGEGMTLCYEIDPKLETSLDETSSKDGNYGLDSKYTALVMNMAVYQKQSMSTRLMKETLLPRIMWISKSITLKQLHFQIFEYLRHTIIEWIDWKDPQTTKVPKDSRNDMRKTLVDFPYRPDNWNGPFTKKDF